MAKLPTDLGPLPPKGSMGEPAKIEPVVPELKLVGGKMRRPLKEREIGLPLSGDSFSQVLKESLERDGMIIPAGTEVIRRVSDALVARWVTQSDLNLGTDNGFWAFEVTTGFSLEFPKETFWVVATPTAGHWREVALAD